MAIFLLLYFHIQNMRLNNEENTISFVIDNGYSYVIKRSNSD
jgi:hypothetical protein